MYFVLEFDKGFGIPAVLTESEPGPDLKYLKGLALETDERPIALSLNSDTAPEGEYPDLFNAVRAPAASKRFRTALERAGIDNVEWFPAAVRTPRGITQSYAVMNVIGRVSCMDMGKSVVTEFRGRVARVKKLAIDETRTNNARLFRLHEYPLALLVAESVAPHLKGLSGLTLVPAKGWSDKDRF